MKKLLTIHNNNRQLQRGDAQFVGRNAKQLRRMARFNIQPCRVRVAHLNEYRTLEKVRDAHPTGLGVLTVAEAGCFLSSLKEDTNRTVCDAAHAVVHFLSDADIRLNDKGYDLLLRTELEKYSKQLREK